MYVVQLNSHTSVQMINFIIYIHLLTIKLLFCVSFSTLTQLLKLNLLFAATKYIIHCEYLTVFSVFAVTNSHLLYIY